MKTVRVSSSPYQAIDLKEIKDYVRVPVGETNEDDLLGSLRLTAHKRVEDIVGRKLLYQKWKVYFDWWPSGKNWDRRNWDSFDIPYPPLRAVPTTGMTYKTSTGLIKVFSSTAWKTDTVSEPGRLVLDYCAIWPTEVLHNNNPIEISFSCGCASSAGSTTLPEHYKVAIKMLIAHYYENRGIVQTQNNYEVPESVKALLQPYRILNP